MTVLNLGKMDDKLKFDVYDWNSSGKSDFIGSFEASLNEITKKSQWPLVNPKKAKKRYQQPYTSRTNALKEDTETLEF